MNRETGATGSAGAPGSTGAVGQLNPLGHSDPLDPSGAPGSKYMSGATGLPRDCMVQRWQQVSLDPLCCDNIFVEIFIRFSIFSPGVSLLPNEAWLVASSSVGADEGTYYVTALQPAWTYQFRLSGVDDGGRDLCRKHRRTWRCPSSHRQHHSSSSVILQVREFSANLLSSAKLCSLLRKF